MKQIVLASSSPRRKRILEQIGLSFHIAPSNIEEKMNARLKPHGQAEFLSKQKANKVAKRYKSAIIIAADTLVVFNDQIIGKPTSPSDAKRILRMLSGKTHTVITGYTIIDTQTNKTITNSVETIVYMKKMSTKEIDAFIKTGEPLDKAGGYGADEKGSLFIEKIEGDFFNVIGLPLFAVAESLRKISIKIL